MGPQRRVEGEAHLSIHKYLGPLLCYRLSSGTRVQRRSRVNKASALRSLAFYGGDRIAMHCDMKKNRSGGGAGGITSLH